MDVKQEINPKAFIFTYLTFYLLLPLISESSEKLTVKVTLVQEVGIDIMV